MRESLSEMHEILSLLGPTDFVLDLGSRSGSFALTETRARVVRVDLDLSAGGPFVQADARCLPFRNASIAAIVANHSLEHVEGLSQCLSEIGRVLRPDGYLYVAVPDAATLSDRIYRWVGHGGGHVNAIYDAADFGQRLREQTSLPLTGIRILHTSFAFLNRSNGTQWPRRVYLVGGGSEWSLRWANQVFRYLDALLGSKLSVYGWAFYLGKLPPMDLVASGNVCMRCGAAHVSEWLRALGVVRGFWIWRQFQCPNCGAKNGFQDDAKRPS
jgi:SAM-dependent methyltransferase